MKNPNTYTQAQRSLGGLNKPRREERFEEIKQRFTDARKGHIVTHGVHYTAHGSTEFAVRHSTEHANRFDLLHRGATIKTGNPRNLPTKWIRQRTRKAKVDNVTYAALTSAP